MSFIGSRSLSVFLMMIVGVDLPSELLDGRPNGIHQSPFSLDMHPQMMVPLHAKCDTPSLMALGSRPRDQMTRQPWPVRRAEKLCFDVVDDRR